MYLILVLSKWFNSSIHLEFILGSFPKLMGQVIPPVAFPYLFEMAPLTGILLFLWLFLDCILFH